MIKSFFYVAVLLFDKTIATCSPGCNEQFIGDYKCDIECNNSYCDFDGGDCLDMNYLDNTNDSNNTNNTNVINEFYSQDYFSIFGSQKHCHFTGFSVYFHLHIFISQPSCLLINLGYVGLSFSCGIDNFGVIAGFSLIYDNRIDSLQTF